MDYSGVILYYIAVVACCSSFGSCLKKPSVLDETDYYKILGVDRKASQAEIKKKFRQLALKYHPDKKEPDSEKIFPKMTEGK